MKKLCTLLAFIPVFNAIRGQSVLSVTAGTGLHIAAGTVFSAGGLSLTPSLPFAVSGTELQIQPTVAHYTANNYVSRVYQFSTGTAPFSGTVAFSYNDGQLNGLSESALQVNVYNGSAWQALSTSTSDAVNNMVVTNGISNRILNEVALAGMSASLPLQWGMVTVSRMAGQITVQWETWQAARISYFTVESSADGRNWTTMADNITARNSSAKEQYKTTGNAYPSAQLYCRVKQTSFDGRQGYSPVALVNSPAEKLLVYPNPVHKEIYFSPSLPGTFSAIHIYNNAGVLLKSWHTVQPSYSIRELATGIYYLQVQCNDGSSRQYKINKL